MAVAKQTYGWQRPASWKEDATEVVDVTPELAKFILDTYGQFNRPVSKSTCLRYAGIMIRGEWNLQDTIEFNINGQLVNGYHRLYAVFLSGVTVKLRFRYGAAIQTFATYDVGKNRTGSDTIIIGANLIKEKVAPKDSRLMSSSVPWVVWYESGYEAQSYKLSNEFKEDFFVGRYSEGEGVNHDDMEEGIKIARAAKRVLKGYDAIVLGLFILGANTPGKKGENRTFWKGVASGANLADGNPALAFREKVRNLRDDLREKGGKLKQDPVFFLGLKCMRVAFDGGSIQRLHVPETITRLSLADERKYSDPAFVCPFGNFGKEDVVAANFEIAAAELNWSTKSK